MFCKECGQVIGEAAKDPWCMYRFENGQVINKMFHPDQIPEGWYDSPKAATAAVKEAETLGKPDKKPKKANSAGLNV